MKLYTREEVEAIAMAAADLATTDAHDDPESMVEGWLDWFEDRLRVELDHAELVDALEKQNARRSA